MAMCVRKRLLILLFAHSLSSLVEQENHQFSKTQAVILTTDEMFIADEPVFAGTNYISMFSESVEDAKRVKERKPGEAVEGRTAQNSVDIQLFVKPMFVRNQEPVKSIEFSDLGIAWIGLKFNSFKEPIRSEFFFLNRQVSEHSSSLSVLKSAGLLNTDMFQRTKNDNEQPENDLYEFYQGEDQENVWRDYKIRDELLEVYSIAWKLRLGFVFYITHIVISPTLASGTRGTDVLKEFKKRHVQQVRLTEPNFMKYHFYKAVPNFFAGYLLVFHNLDRSYFYFAYQPTEPGELSRNNNDGVLKCLQEVFQRDFSRVIDLKSGEVEFEVFPVISKSSRTEAQQRILMISLGSFRRIYDIDKYRGFQVINLANFQSYLDLSPYNEWYYLYLKDLRNTESLLDLFRTQSPKRKFGTATESHFFYTNSRKNQLLLVRFRKLNFRHLTVRMLTYFPFINTFGRELRFRLLDLPLSQYSFLDYVELFQFHIFLFSDKQHVLVYRVTKTGPMLDVSQELRIKCSFNKTLPSYHLNQLFFICNDKIVMVPFQKKIFMISYPLERKDFEQSAQSVSIPTVPVWQPPSVNYNFALNYPNAKDHVNLNSSSYENIILRFYQNYDMSSAISMRFLESQRLDFMGTYTLCKDYLFAGPFVGLTLRVLTQEGTELQRHEYQPLEKSFSFNFESIVKTHAFSFVTGDKETRNGIINSKVFLLMQTKDNILYFYEGISKFESSKSTQRFLRLTNIRRLLQCNLVRTLTVLSSLLIGCQDRSETIQYHLFDKEQRNFSPVPEFDNCDTLNAIQDERLFLCVRNGKTVVFTDARGKIRQLGLWDSLLDPSMRLYPGNTRSSYIVRYRPMSGRKPNIGVELTRVSVTSDDKVVFSHLLSVELSVDWETSCTFLSRVHTVILLCDQSFYVYYLHEESKTYQRVKKVPLKFGGRTVRRLPDFQPQVLVHSNKFFQNPLSATQNSEIVVAFVGCLDSDCGVIHFNARSTLASSFGEFVFHGKEADLKWDRLTFSSLDVFSSQFRADAEPVFKGYVLSERSEETVESGFLYYYKTRIIYPFKAHFVLNFYGAHIFDFLTIEALPYQLPNGKQDQSNALRLTIERCRERQLDVDLRPDPSWIRRLSDFHPDYHAFELLWSEHVGEPILSIACHTDHMADNFAGVTRIAPRIATELLLSFKEPIAKRIEGCDSRPLLNMVNQMEEYYVQTDNLIFKFSGAQLTEAFPLTKFLYLPVDFLTKTNEIDCVFKMLPKTAIVLTLCRPKNSKQHFKLFNFQSLDSQLKSSPDLFNYLERIRRSEYQQIQIKKNQIVLKRQLIEDRNELRDVIYPFILFRKAGKQLFWISEPIPCHQNTLYAKVHWLKKKGNWYTVHVTVSFEFELMRMRIENMVYLGQTLVHARRPTVLSVGIMEALQNTPKNLIVSQLTKQYGYIIFPLKMRILMAVRWFVGYDSFTPSSEFVFNQESSMVSTNFEKNSIQTAFWRLKFRHSTTVPKMRYLPSKPGTLVVLVGGVNYEHLNVIRLEYGNSDQTYSNFQEAKTDSVWSNFLSSSFLVYASDNAKVPFATRIYASGTIRSARLLNRPRPFSVDTPLDYFELAVLRRNRITILKVYDRQVLEVRKSFFRSKDIVFTINSPSHLTRFTVNVKDFKDYFNLPQQKRLFDGYYLLLSIVLVVGGALAIPLYDWYKERRQTIERKIKI